MQIQLKEKKLSFPIISVNSYEETTREVERVNKGLISLTLSQEGLEKCLKLIKNAEKLLVLLDFDGTITKVSSDHKRPCQKGHFEQMDMLMAKELSTKALNMRNYYLGIVSKRKLLPKEEIDWLKHTVDLYVKSKLNKKQVFHIADSLELRDGFKNFIDYIQTKQGKIAVISYGLRDIIERFLNNTYSPAMTGQIFDIFATKLLYSKQGVITGYDANSVVCPHQKAKCVSEFIQKYSLDTSIANISVGDSVFDKSMFSKGSLRIYFYHHGYKHRQDLDESNLRKIYNDIDLILVGDSFNPLCELFY